MSLWSLSHRHGAPHLMARLLNLCILFRLNYCDPGLELLRIFYNYSLYNTSIAYFFITFVVNSSSSISARPVFQFVLFPPAAGQSRRANLSLSHPVAILSFSIIPDHG